MEGVESGKDCACINVTVSIHKCVSVQEMEARALHMVDQLSTLEFLSTSSLCLLSLFCLAAPCLLILRPHLLSVGITDILYYAQLNVGSGSILFFTTD